MLDNAPAEDLISSLEDQDRLPIIERTDEALHISNGFPGHFHGGTGPADPMVVNVGNRGTVLYDTVPDIKTCRRLAE